MSASLIMAGSAGTIYAQATLLPFVLIQQVGLSPAEFKEQLRWFAKDVMPAFQRG